MKTCDYCGHQWTDTFSLDLDLDLDVEPPARESEPLPSVDAAMDHAAAPVPVAPVPPKPVPAETAESLILESLTSEVASEPVASEPLASELEVSEPVVSEAAKPVQETSVPVAVPAAPVKGRHVATVATGLVAAGALIVTLLSMRSSASPPASAAGAKRTAPATAAPAPVTSRPAPTWTHATEGRWIPAGRKNLALELQALNKVQVWTRLVTPTLVVRCSAGEIETFVYTASAARMEPQDGDHTVHLGFDNAAERTERWPDSESHDALFARDGAAFAQQLMQARTLRFGFSPHNASPVVANFAVSGLAELLASAPKQCGYSQQNKRKK